MPEFFRRHIMQLIVAAFVLVGIAVAVTYPSATTKPFKIGVLLPLTGNASAIGEYVKTGIELGVAGINARGGISGKPLEVIYEDTKNDPKEGVSIINRLVSTENIPAVVVAMTGVANAVIPVADANKIVVMATTVSASGITDKSPYAFRLFVTADLDAAAMAKFAGEQIGLKNVAIIHVNDDFGISFARVFRANFASQGRLIAHQEAYEKGSTDFRTILQKVKAADPDGIYLLGYDNNLGLLPQQIREAGISAPLLSIGTLGQPNVMKQAGATLEGAYFTTTEFAADAPGNQEARVFVESFKKTYGKDPNYFSAFSYDAIGLLAATIEKNGVTSNAIKAGLASTSAYKGAMGELAIKANRDADFRMIVKQIRDGKAINVP